MAGEHQGEPAKKTTSSKVSVDRTMSRSSSSGSDDLTDISSIDEDIAQTLRAEGYEELEDISKAEIEELNEATDLDREKIEQIKSEIDDQEGDEQKSEEEAEKDDLADWLTGESDDDVSGIMGGDQESKDEDDPFSKSGEKSTESLKAWLSGEKDSFTEWLEEDSFEEEKEEIEEELKEKEERLEKKERELEEKKQEIEELREKLKDRLSDFESDDFEPDEVLEENARLEQELENKSEEIEELREEREEILEEKENLEDEIQDIKKGSVAMVKYLKSQQGAFTESSENKVKSEEFETLEEENERLKEKIEELRSDGASTGAQIQKGKEQTNKEMRELKKELAHKEEKIEDLKEQVKHKEKELNEREEDLMHREQVIRKERKKLEAQKKELENTTEQERKRELEELKQEIEKKEQELKAKKKYINQKEKELRAKEEELIDEELEEKEQEILREIEQEKCKTGTGRLDDLLLGGIPLGSNVSIYGPPHVGKEIMVNSFIGEGLEKGVPAIWVITDKTIGDIREEMKFVLPTYEEYEMRDLIYYVDAYSASMGKTKEEERKDDNVRYIKDQSDLKAITDAVNEFAEEIKENHRYYRMAFESVSTIIAYLDSETTFRILQPFTGKRKRDNAVSLYTLEKGMHTDQEISMLGHIMDGEIKFKIDQLKNYLKVEGLGDVQTRDWIEYNQSKSGITMGSFSLDTIR